MLVSVENQTLEWKESWRDEYLKWISVFANSVGGIMEIGRRDDGKVIGIPNAKNHSYLLKVLELSPHSGIVNFLCVTFYDTQKRAT